MTPIAESLAGSSGGQRRFIKQLILLTDNPPPTPLRFNSCQALRSSCLFVFWERNYFAIASSLKKKTQTLRILRTWGKNLSPVGGADTAQGTGTVADCF